MTAKELMDKLTEFTPSITVAIEVTEDIGLIVPVFVCYQDFAFRVEKYQDGSSPKPYYKLLISPIKEA